MQSVSIVGCGYTGLRLARRCLGLGYAVHGYATRAARLAEIAAVGARAESLDLDAPQAAAGQPALDVGGQLVYYAVPPSPHHASDVRLDTLLARLHGSPRRVIYLSTTGVYGNRDGGRVDEDTPPAPLTERAARRLEAESALRRWATQHTVSWCILRIPGIYGPDRLPLDRLRRGEPAIDPNEASPGNRIHVEDLVSACLAAGVNPRADGRIYNVTDGNEDSVTAYLQRVARICGLPPPPLVSRATAEQSFSQLAWSFLGESRRVSNRRMLDELGVGLVFGELDAGIRASM